MWIEIENFKAVLLRDSETLCPHCGKFFPSGEGIKYVKCQTCGEKHFIESDTYVTVYGDIHIGHTGGIVGHNFGFKSDPTKKDGPPTQLSRAMVYCRRPCFVELAIDIADRE